MLRQLDQLKIKNMEEWFGVLKDKNGPMNLNNSTLETAWNSKYMKNVRNQMLAGEKPPSCIKCFKEEDAGHRSKRQWETEYWSKRVDWKERLEKTDKQGNAPQSLPYIDLRLGSKCNLKCFMCSPFDSSLWIPDWQKLFPKIENENLKDTMQWNDKGRVNGSSFNWHKNNKDFWTQLYAQIPNMKQLYFAGGESTIIEEHYSLLEEVIKMGYAKNIELRYNSNGVEMPNKLFELWNQFKRVRFHFSLDSIYEMNDYIRYPSDFNSLVQNLHKLDQTDDNIEVTVACTAQMLNMYYIPDFIQWKMEQGFKKINPWPLGAGLINYHFLYHPAHLNVKVFPNYFKEKIEEKYETFIPWLTKNYKHATNVQNISKEMFENAPYGPKRLRGMVNFMKSEDWSNRMPEFREYIKHMDSIRNTNFEEVFSEMVCLMNE